MAEYRENWDYYRGNHWQFWIGIRFAPENDPHGYRREALQRVFQSANLIAECVDNWRDGLIGEPFNWYLVAKGTTDRTESTTVAELEVQRWINSVNRKANEQREQINPWHDFVLSLGVTGVGTLRLWQSQKFANSPDLVDRLHLQSVPPDAIALEFDDEEFLSAIEYSYGKGQKQRLTMVERVLQVEFFENGISKQTKPFDSGGIWTIQQVRKPSIITSSIKRLQNALNHLLTMVVEGQESNGFPQWVLFNAQIPGEDVLDPTSPTGYRFVPAANDAPVGRGMMRYIEGRRGGTDNDPIELSPSAMVVDPIDLAPFEAGLDIWKQSIYQQFRQAHLAGEGKSAQLSEESRIQMRQGFERVLNGTRAPLEAAIANILTIVARFLGYPDLEAVVELKISTGKLSPKERAEIRAEYQEKLRSLPNTLAALGNPNDVLDQATEIESEETQD